MTPFDLEAAKRGEPVISRFFEKNTPPVRFIAMRFIGMKSDGVHAVIEHHDGMIDCYAVTDLLMAPRKVVKWKWMDVDSRGFSYDSEAEALKERPFSDSACKLCRVEWED